MPAKTQNRTLTRSKFIIALSGYILLALLVLFIAPFLGSESLDVQGVFQRLINNRPWDTDTSIFVNQRIPRVILGMLIGGSLAICGATLQVLLRNPLAAPSTLGVTGGGTIGAVLAISIPGLTISWGAFSTVQLLALLGASLATGLIYMLARRSSGLSMHTLLLAGITIGILCQASILMVSYLADPNMLVTMNRWMMGGIDVVGYRKIIVLLPMLMPGIGILLMQTNALNHLALGSQMASGHGIDVKSVRMWSFIGTSITAAAAVSVAGPISFVGLIVPHMVRMLSGYDHRILLPGSFLAGGAMLTICDTIARTIIAPTEMPVGIITAVTGGPLFIYLLVKKRY